MRKILMFLLCATLLLSFAACGGGEDASEGDVSGITSTGNTSGSTTSESTETSESTDTSAESNETALDLGSLYQEYLDGASKVDNLENAEWKYTVHHSKYGPRAQVTITNYLGTSSSVTIPETIDGYPVTRLANNVDVFASNMNMADITDIAFPDTLYFITGDMLNDTAWYQNQSDGLIYAGKILYKYKGNMDDGTTVIVADGTVSICGSAFSYQKGIKELVMPDTVVHLGGRAFQDCKNLERVRLSTELRYIGTWVLKNSTKLTELYISKKMYKLAQSFSDSGVYAIYYEGSESEWSSLCTRSRMTDEFAMYYNQTMPEK